MNTVQPVSVPYADHRDGAIQSSRQAATQLEATFLTEMLKAAGMGQGRSEMGGGAGEEQFSSFLLRQQAEQIVRAGGIGLSEVFFQTLMEEKHGA